MAVTADQVSVVLQADVDSYVRDLRRADTAFDGLVSSMQTGLTQSGRAFSTLAVGANASATSIVASTGRINSALAVNNANVSNIAAQFQDIGVTAAMGMNPLIIALQQGTQLSAVFNQSMQAGISPAKALGAAFLQVLNPISLGTIALVALTAAAAQYFGSLIADGSISNEKLKEQEDAVRRVADRWGDAVPALKAYVDQLDRAQQASDEEVALGVLSKDQMSSALADVRVLQDSFMELDIQLRNLGADSSQVMQFYDAVNQLGYALEDGSVKAEDVSRVTASLAVLQAGPASSALAKFTAGWSALTGAIQGAIAAQQAAAGQIAANTPELDAAKFVAGQKLINDMTSEELALHNEIARVRAQAERDGIAEALGEERIVQTAKERLAAEERRRALAAEANAAGKSSEKSQSEAEREAQAVLDLIEALEYEQSLLGMTAEQKAVANALREAGSAATEKQREKIEELITATMAEADAIKASEQAMKKFQDMAANALTGFISDLRAGKSGAEALSNTFNKIADQLIQMAVQGLVMAAFGGGGGAGNPLGTIIGNIFGGARANGGPVSGGKSYLVGERGPELFTPSSAGNITSNNKLGASSGVTTIMLEVQEGAAFSTRILQVSGPQSAQIAGTGLKSYDSNLAGRVGEQDGRYN